MPLNKWIEEYSANPAPETVIDLLIIYIRGYAMNYIEKLLQELILLNSEHHHVIINWHYCMNSISVKAGEHLSRKLNYLFNFLEVEGIS